jgi:hypothetical protein
MQLKTVVTETKNQTKTTYCQTCDATNEYGSSNYVKTLFLEQSVIIRRSRNTLCEIRDFYGFPYNC